MRQDVCGTLGVTGCAIVWGAAFLISPLTAAERTQTDKPLDVAAALSRPIVDPQQVLSEVQAFTQARIVPMPESRSVAEWEQHAGRIRKDVLKRVVFRGEAERWRDAPTRVEWLETIDGGPGYRIRKLRFEALPGLWIPALLYEPETLPEKTPVVLNVNGHDGDGKAAPYKQLRSINLAKRGMLALNVEWFGMGQLRTSGFNHYRLNQIDLCGTSGLAPFYLSMKRSLDLLLSLPAADPKRVAVAGLSGGGWQTILISSLDERVTLANPVAGYSSYLQRADVPPDLGDSEQSPVDMGSVADYLHLTALRAPRPTLLTYNAADNCCFKADHALPPLVAATRPIFELYGKGDALRSHVNIDPGTHNFELDNRQQFYRMIGDFFYPDGDFQWREIASDAELKTKEQLHVDLPEQGADFHTLAIDLAKNLPRDPELPAGKNWQMDRRERLRELVRWPQADDVTAIEQGAEEFADATVRRFRLRIGGSWTLPLIDITPADAESTVVLVADSGFANSAEQVEELLSANQRVVAVDVYNIGAARPERWQDRYGLFLSAVGERALGIQAHQLASVARWLTTQSEGKPRVVAHGPRASLLALVAAALETDAVDGLELHGSYGSLKEIIEQDLSAPDGPELFCFGLLEQFDVLQLAALAIPREVRFIEPGERVRQELAELDEWYKAGDVDFDPLQ